MARQYSPEEISALADSIRGMGRVSQAPVQTTDQNSGYLGDLGTAAKKSFQTIPGALTGLVDIPVGAITGQNYVSQGADWLGQQTGFQPGKWAQEATTEYSPATQQQLANYQDVEGFLPSISYLATNPSLAGLYATESLGSMVAGGAIGKGLQAAKLVGSALKGAAVGEGAIMGGQQMQNLMEQGADARTAAGASALTGVLGGAIGLAGGAAAQRMGLTDIDVLLAGGGRATGTAVTAAEGSLARKMLGYGGYLAKGGFQEGVLEEAPQSFLESVISNLALGKDPLEGVGKDVATGLAAGAAMGVSANVLGRRTTVDSTPGNTDSETPIAAPIPESVLASLGITEAELDSLETQSGTQINTKEELAIQLLNSRKITPDQYNSVVSDEFKVDPSTLPTKSDIFKLTRLAKEVAKNRPKPRGRNLEDMLAREGGLPTNALTTQGATPTAPSEQSLRQGFDEAVQTAVKNRQAQISRLIADSRTKTVFGDPRVTALREGAQQVASPSLLGQSLFPTQPVEADAVLSSALGEQRAKARTKRAVQKAIGRSLAAPQGYSLAEPLEVSPLRQGIRQAMATIPDAQREAARREAEKTAALEANAALDPAIDTLGLPLIDSLAVAVGVDAAVGETAGTDQRIDRIVDPIASGAGQPATKIDEQMFAADSSWRALVAYLPKLEAEGIDTTNLRQILSDVVALAGDETLEGLLMRYQRARGGVTDVKGRDDAVSSRDKTISARWAFREKTNKDAARKAAVEAALAEGKSEKKAQAAGKDAADAIPTGTGAVISRFFEDVQAELARLGATATPESVNLADYSKNKLAYEQRLADIESNRLRIFNRNLMGLQAPTSDFDVDLDNDTTRQERILPSEDTGVEVDYLGYVDSFFRADGKPRKTSRTGAKPEGSAKDPVMVRDNATGRVHKWRVIRAVDGRTRQQKEPPKKNRLSWLNKLWAGRSRAAAFLADSLESYQGRKYGVPVDELINGISAIGVNNADPYSRLIDTLLRFGMNDTRVYAVSNAELDQAYRDAAGNMEGKIYGIFENENGTTSILINEDILGTRQSVQTLMHEVMHDMTLRELDNNPRMRDQMERLMNTAKQALIEQGVPFDQQVGAMYGFMNVKEFVAEAYTSVEFQELLAGIQVQEKSGRISTLWDTFKRFVRQLFGIENDPVLSGSVLDQVLTLSDLLMERQAANRDDPTRVNPEYWLGNSVDPQWGFSEATADSLARTADKIFGENNSITNVGEAFSWFRLGIMRLDQLVRTFKDDIPSLKAYDDITREKNNIARTIQHGADKISRIWNELPIDESLELSILMRMATALGIHPDLAWMHPKNMHLFKSKKASQKRSQYDVLRTEWLALQAKSPKAVSLYKQSETFFAERRAQITQYAIEHISTTYKTDEVLTSQEKAKFETVKSAADVDALNLDNYGSEAENIRDSLKRVLRSSKVPGPYFPLRRFGDYVIDAVKTRTATYPTRDVARQIVKEFEANPDNYGQKAKVVEQEDGRWTVEFTERYFEMFQSERAANEALKDYKAKGFTQNKPERYGVEGTEAGELGVHLKRDQNVELDNADMLLMSRLKQKFNSGSGDKAKANAKIQQQIETAFIELLADSSIRRAELRRSVVRGETEDMQRAFAERALASSWAEADMATSLKRENIMQKAQDESNKLGVDGERVIEELRKREGQSISDRTVSSLDRMASRYGFIMNLMSPSYAMVNMTQVPLITVPYLSSKYGFAATNATLWGSYNKMVSVAMQEFAEQKGGWSGAPDEFLDKVLNNIITDSGVKEAIKVLTDQGIIDATFMQELYETSKGTSGGGAMGMAATRTLDIARFAPQLVEIINRVITTKAAYQLEKAQQDKLIDKKIKQRTLRGGAIAAARDAAHQTAIEAAREAVLQTQFDYSDMNKPRLFKGPPGVRTIMMFKMYAQGIYALMVGSFLSSIDTTDKTKEGKAKRKEARKMLTGLLATHSLAAGAAGGLLSEPVRLAIALAGTVLGDADDDDDFFNDPEYAMRQWIADMSNESIAEVAMKGAPRALGLDLNSRLGLQNLMWMRQEPADSYAESYNNAIVGLLGPVANNIRGHFRSLDYFKKGDVIKGIETSMPKAARDLLRTYRYYDEGLTSYTGTSIMEPDNMLWHDLMFQSIGFSPANVAEKYDARRKMTQREMELNNRRKQIVEDFNKADPADRGKIISDKIIDWNVKHPEFAITSQTLITSVRSRNKDALESEQDIYSRRYSINEIGKSFNTR